MALGRWLGFILLLCALVVLGRDVVGRVDTGRFAPVSGLQLWYDLSSRTAEATRQVVEAGLGRWAWEGGVAPILDLWAFALLLGLGLVLLWAFRRRSRRRR
jgi:hypothetical protein